MTLRLLKDRLLVLLPPPQELGTHGLIEAPAIPPPPTFGRVILTGPSCRDVRVGDAVTFGPEAGDPYDYQGYACLLLREPDVQTIVSRKESA